MSTQTGVLPAGAVLVHIGPYKTGTTAIQNSLHERRAELTAAGVTYPGTFHRQMRPSWALLGRSRIGEAGVPASEWDDMVAEARAATGRVVISSEDFCSAGRQQAQRLVDDLGPERVHVLLTARGLDRLLPSAWQERVKSVNETRTYDEWLREVLGPEREGKAARTFWHNHDLERVLERWLHAVPPDRVLVIVNDESDRGLQARTFEQLLDLPDGLLTPGPRRNTSLSMERIELCRQVNLAAVANGWVGSRRLNAPRRAMLTGLLASPPAEWETPIPPMPAWSGPRLTELSDQRADSVAASGVRVLGDPDLLRHAVHHAVPDVREPPPALPVSAAVGAVEHALDGMLRPARGRRPRAPAVRLPDPVVAASTRALLRELARRPLARLGHGSR